MCLSAFGQYIATQTSPITINDNAAANPYPSVIDLTGSNILGTIEGVVITVNGLTADYAPDIGLLLQAPNSNSVVLMNGAGGSSSGTAPLNNITLTFQDDVNGTLQAGVPLSPGGTYKPANLVSGFDFSDFGTAPAPPYMSRFDQTLFGINPNGKWKLYVVDSSPGPGQGLWSLASWTLNIYTTPTLAVATNTSVVADSTGHLTITVPENGTTPSSVTVNLVVADSSTPLNSLVISNTAIPALATNFSYGGSDANRTTTITPNQYTYGTNNNFIINVSDGIASGTVSTNVTLAVTHVDQQPTIKLSTNALTAVAGLMSTNSITATLSSFDPDFHPATGLNLVAFSSDPTVVLPSGVFFTQLSGGTANTNKTAITVVPATGGSGTATITVQVDNGAKTNSATFDVTVLPAGNPQYASTNAINVAAGANASTTITIPANTYAGLVGQASVSLVGLKGFVPSASTVVLTAPNGTSVTLLPKAGVPTSAQNYGQILFADAASTNIPASDNLSSTVFTPPASPLLGLSGVNANGTWRLSVTNSSGAAEQIAGGWVLNLLIAPTISAIQSPVRGPEESTQSVSFTVADVDGTVTNVTGSFPTGTDLATITTTTTGNNVTMALQGRFNTPGTNNVQVVAKDNHGLTATNSFRLELFFVDHPPFFDFIGRQVTSAGEVLGPIKVVVHDPDTPLSSVQVRVSSDNSKLFPTYSMLLVPNGLGTNDLTLFPVGNIAGSANIILTADDGTLQSNLTFNVSVQDPGVPLLINANPITIHAGTTASPYPSTNTVSSLIGNVEKVRVTLLNVTHPAPGNLSALLVAPNGTTKNVILMQGAGDGNALTSAIIGFDDDASQLPLGSPPISSGIYKPTTYGTVVSLPPPAPGIPYASGLSNLAGAGGVSPNGDWKLYMSDGGSARDGVVQNGWQLSIQTTPNVQPVPDQSTAENIAARVSVVVGDNQPGVNTTVVASADPTYVQSIAVSGSGATRTLLITPVPYTFHSNIVVTVTATDPAGKSSQGSFLLHVYPVAQPPLFVTSPADQTIPAATQLPAVSFKVFSPQGSTLTLAASSPDNAALVPSSNISITPNGTAGANTNIYNITLIPAGNATGVATINIVATDSAGLKSISSFKVTVTQNLAFANTGLISIPQGPFDVGQYQEGIATPYPSTVSVKGLGGVVSSVQVALVGLTHPFPHDLDILVVSPDNSTAVMLMAHAGGGSAPLSGARLTFDDNAATQIPQSGTLASGTYRPGEYTPFLTLPAPALPPPALGASYSTNLSDFADLDPNGNWQLYVLDDTYPDGGSIDNGWILYLQTKPAISSISDQTTLENTAVSIPLALSDASNDPTNLTVSAATSGDFPPGLVDPTNLVVRGTGAARSLTITPTLNLPSSYNAINNYSNAPGTNLVTVTASNVVTHLANTTSFGLTVSYVNQAPSITTATNRVFIDQNTSNNQINYTIGDVDSVTARTNIFVTSLDQTLVANSNITVTFSAAIAPGTTGPATVKITPVLNAHGTNQIFFALTDGNSFTTNTLTLVINHIWQGPTITSVPSPQPVQAGGATTNIAFTVGSVEISAKNLLVWATSSNPNLVPNTAANIVLGGAAESRTVQLITIGTSTADSTITLFVTDNAGQANSTNQTSFILHASQAPITTFANQTIITTSGAGKANVYPSPIPVGGLSVAGLVPRTFKVTAVLPDFSHNAPANLDVLLVERDNDGKTNAVVLMSGAGDSTAVNNLRLTFDDTGALLPNGALTSGTYQPANLTKGLIMPAPAPTNSLWSLLLSGFNGFNPNGIWELYVNDRGAGDSGTLASGWQLNIETAPVIGLASGTPHPLTFAESTPANPTSATVNFTIGDQLVDISNLTVVASTTDPVLIPPRNVTFSTPVRSADGHSGTMTATINPASLQSGTNNLTLTIQRPADGANASVTLPILITPVNAPPTISRLDNITVPENTSSNIQFIVSDPDTPLSSLTVTATSSDTVTLPNSGLNFIINGVPSGTNRLVGLPGTLLTLGITPTPFKTGTPAVTISVHDPQPDGTNDVSAPPFTVNVAAVQYSPIITSKISSQTVAAGGSTPPIPFTVGSPTGIANTYTGSGTSSDQSLVKDANISVVKTDASGTNWTVTVKSENNTPGGTASITVTIKDPANNKTDTATFALTVRPSRVRNYANTTPITINDNATATPYPSQIAVSGLVGPIGQVTATLKGFSHTFPSDVGVLLVGPSGQKIVLMSNVGDGHPGVAGANLTFDQTASASVPVNSAPTTGSYLPTDNSGGTRTFDSPAPGGPYTNLSLNVFNGTNPNGTWSLYVKDYFAGDFGAITNGWSIGITTLPVINGLTDVTTNQDSAAVQSFTVADDSVSAPIFTFSGLSDTSTVVTNAGIVFSGSGTNWTVAVNPVPNASGSAKISVVMQNGDGQTITNTFKATFTPVTHPPFINAIADQTTPAGTSLLVPLVYGNPGVPQNQLAVTFTSSDTNLVPQANMKLVGTNLLIAAAGVQTGSSQITVLVTNPSNLTANATFKFNVAPGSTNVYANTRQIVINDNAAANPYPSTITVSGLAGNISKVTATVVGLAHTFPSDVSILLVGPQGQKVVLMSRAGGAASMTNTRLQFDDNGATLPQNTLIADGTYKPTDYKTSDTFFSPAPIAPYAHAMNAFNGTNPNGDWQLWVQDDQSPDSGVITGGWILSILTTGPVISFIPPQTTLENNNVTVNFNVSSATVNASNLIVTASNSGDIPAGLVSKMSLGGFGSSRTLTISPAANLPSLVTNIDGTSTITVSVTDGTLTNSESFQLTVTYVNQPPTVTGLTDQTTAANVPHTVNFTVSDVDTPVSNLVVAATGSVPGLGTIAVGGSGAARTLTFTPAGVIGVDQVSVTVSDGPNTVTNNIAITVTNGTLPVVSSIAPQTIPKALAATPVVANFTVDTGPIAATNLQVVASADNTNLVTSVVVAGTAPSFTLTATVAPLTVGNAIITVFARDEYGVGTGTFNLAVTATNYPPTLGAIPDRTVTSSAPVAVQLAVSDPDTALSALTFSSVNSNPALVSGVTFATVNTTNVAIVSLVTNQSGSARITITVSDGTTPVSQSFNLTVNTSTKPPPTLGISHNGKQVTISLHGVANTTYTVQISTDLKTFTNNGTVTTDASGSATVNVTATGVKQFTRAVAP
jgi:subtilisin-like proprotein convertase family protein